MIFVHIRWKTNKRDKTMQKLQKTILSILFLLFMLLSAQGQQQWQQKTAMPTQRQGMAAAALNGKIYVIGGAQFEFNAINTVEAYDVLQDNWQTNIGTLNVPRTKAAAVSYGGKIYVFGGRDHHVFISEVEVYDPGSNQWTIISQIPTPREGLAAVVVDSLIWLIGGATMQTSLGIVELYNPGSNSWSTLPHQLTVPRATAVAEVIDGQVYAFGGFYFGPLNSYEKYIPGQGWVDEGVMMYSCGAAGGAAVNGEIWIVGGENQSGILGKVQYADIAGQGPWNSGPQMQTPRKNLSVVRVDNTLFAIGGKTEHHGGSVTGAVEALGLVTAINEPPGSGVIERLVLGQNYPNPFNGTTLFQVALEKPTEVRIDVINVRGQLVRQIYRGVLMGQHLFKFDGKNDSGKALPSGNYFIYLKTSKELRVIKATYLK